MYTLFVKLKFKILVVFCLLLWRTQKLIFGYNFGAPLMDTNSYIRY